MKNALESLVRKVGERVHSSSMVGRAWVLVDPLVRDPFDDPQLEEFGVHKARIHVPNRMGDTSRLPYMLPLDATSDGVALLRATCLEALDEQDDSEKEAVNGFAIGAWVTSKCSEADLVAHWSKVCSVRVKGAGRRYLRVADRRVLHWLWQRLTDAQRAYAAGPIERFFVLDRRSEVIELLLPVEADVLALSEVWRFPAEVLEMCEVVQAMLRGWSKFESRLPVDYLQRAELVVREAKEAGGQGIHDQVLLGAYALQAGPYVCRSPKIRDIVADCNKQDESLALRLSALLDTDWDDISAASPSHSFERRAREIIQGVK